MSLTLLIQMVWQMAPTYLRLTTAQMWGRLDRAMRAQFVAASSGSSPANFQPRLLAAIRLPSYIVRIGLANISLRGRKTHHIGVDFAASTGAAIYATAPGTVVFAGWRGRFGRTIEIDHGHGLRTRYAHLRKILVKTGHTAENREKIGLMGSSGRSTGPHLHYEVRYKGRALNPIKFLNAGNHVFKG